MRFAKISQGYQILVVNPSLSLVCTLKESACKCRRPQFDYWARKIWRRRDRLPTPAFWSFPRGSASACNEGDLGWYPWVGQFPGEGKGYQLQYSGLENSVDCIAHGVAKSRTLLSHFHLHVIVVQTPSCVQNILLNIKDDNNEWRKEWKYMSEKSKMANINPTSSD